MLWQEVVTSLLEHCNVKVITSSARHPQSQGSVEKLNGEVKKAVFQWMRVNNSSQWSTYLDNLQLSLNTDTQSHTHKETPYRIMFGREIHSVAPGERGQIIHEDDYPQVSGVIAASFLPGPFSCLVRC